MGRAWVQNYGTSTSHEAFGSWFMSQENPMWREGHISGWIWFFGILAAIFGIVGLAIPIAILVLLIVLIIKLIRSFKFGHHHEHHEHEKETK